jgi:hypothetical protein
MLRPTFSTENGFSEKPVFCSGDGGNQTQITRFSITPKSIHLCYSLPQKNSRKGQKSKRAKSQSPGETHATRKPMLLDAEVGVAPDAAAERQTSGM